MPQTNRNQNYDSNGNLISETLVVISDEQLYREATERRIANQYATLREWATDAQSTFEAWPTLTAAQKDARLRETIRRIGVMCDGLADFIMRDGLA